MTEATEEVQEVSSRERADQSFRIVVEAIDAAMIGQFPVGINHVEAHLRIKGALQYISEEMKKLYPEEVVVAPEVEDLDTEHDEDK